MTKITEQKGWEFPMQEIHFLYIVHNAVVAVNMDSPFTDIDSNLYDWVFSQTDTPFINCYNGLGVQTFGELWLYAQYVGYCYGSGDNAKIPYGYRHWKQVVSHPYFDMELYKKECPNVMDYQANERLNIYTTWFVVARNETVYINYYNEKGISINPKDSIYYNPLSEIEVSPPERFDIPKDLDFSRVTYFKDVGIENYNDLLLYAEIVSHIDVYTEKDEKTGQSIERGKLPKGFPLWRDLKDDFDFDI